MSLYERNVFKTIYNQLMFPEGYPKYECYLSFGFKELKKWHTIVKLHNIRLRLKEESY